MGFLSFTAWQFAAAGTLCAAGPVIIHLLNRRRYRVVKWAAMDFLRQALQRNQRILQIRDILLLILRTAAVLLFGLALARPYFATRQEQFDQGQPLHAVIILDNSLSMAYESLEGTLLDKAKDRARQLIEKLPAGSRISIIPACGSREGASADPYDTNVHRLLVTTLVRCGRHGEARRAFARWAEAMDVVDAPPPDDAVLGAGVLTPR